MKIREVDRSDVFFADYFLKGGEISIILPSESAVAEFFRMLARRYRIENENYNQ